MEDQYLRRDFRLKSVSTTSRPLPRMPGSRNRRIYYCKFTLICTVSSGPQLAALELKNYHVLITIHDNLTRDLGSVALPNKKASPG
ncbi:hypothetical protein EFP35_13570 [Lactiplantibacillus pentosus]|nr:hypothetical protein [Lactiplantibacillus pentosus]